MAIIENYFIGNEMSFDEYELKLRAKKRRKFVLMTWGCAES